LPRRHWANDRAASRRAPTAKPCTSRSADHPTPDPASDPKTLPPPDRSADGIGEVDATTYKIRRVIHAGADPEQVDVSADGTRLYVANEDTAQVSVVDLTSGAVVTAVKVGEEPEGVTIRPDGKVVYVTSEDAGAVYAIDTADEQSPRPHSGRIAAALDRVSPRRIRAPMSRWKTTARWRWSMPSSTSSSNSCTSRVRATRPSRGPWASSSTRTDRRCM
jgi:YVTN family beta-propeller protein